MRNFLSLLISISTLTLTFLLTGCWATVPYQTAIPMTDDDDTATDDDDSALPADDDDTLPADDDDSTPVEDDDDATPDPCEGIDSDVDWDCDGNVDTENGESYFPDPEFPRALFRTETVGWTSDPDEVSGAGSGFGDEDPESDPSDWDFDPEARPVDMIGDGRFWESYLDPFADGDEDGCTVYRHTIRGEGNRWADLACEGPHADPACLADCDGAHAMAVVACVWGTHVASVVERVGIPDTGVDCVQAE